MPTAKVHLRQAQPTELARLRATHELDIQRHMQHRGRIHENHSVLIGDGAGLFKLGTVEGDRLFAEHVLSGRERTAQVLDMGVVRRGDIDRIDGRIRIELLDRIIHTLDAIFLSERLRL